MECTVNVRHYNNKQHHTPTRGGETMVCVGRTRVGGAAGIG